MDVWLATAARPVHDAPCVRWSRGRGARGRSGAPRLQAAQRPAQPLRHRLRAGARVARGGRRGRAGGVRAPPDQLASGLRRPLAPLPPTASPRPGYSPVHGSEQFAGRCRQRSDQSASACRGALTRPFGGTTPAELRRGCAVGGAAASARADPRRSSAPRPAARWPDLPSVLRAVRARRPAGAVRRRVRACHHRRGHRDDDLASIAHRAQAIRGGDDDAARPAVFERAWSARRNAPPASTKARRRYRRGGPALTRRARAGSPPTAPRARRHPATSVGPSSTACASCATRSRRWWTRRWRRWAGSR